MKVTKLDVNKNSASCSFCDKGKLSQSGTRLIFPYETTYQIQREGSGTQANICDECLKELNTKVNRTTQKFNVGDLVEPIEGHGIRSGSSSYNEAVVISVEPFFLVSIDADMLWTSQQKENFDVAGTVSASILKKCLKRLK